MSLTFPQWCTLIFVDAPAAKADASTLTVAEFAAKWIPRLQAYGFALEGEPVMSPHQAVKKINEDPAAAEMTTIDRAGGNPGGGG